jgi:hypothetical protein
VTAVERKYTMTKIEGGDYLLPSNDGTILWRIASYQDGRHAGLEDGPEYVTRWRIHRWAYPIGDVETHADPDDWEQWVYFADGFLTRAEAVEYALR